MNVNTLKKWKYEGLRRFNEDESDITHCFSCQEYYINVKELEYLNFTRFLIMKRRFKKGYSSILLSLKDSDIIIKNLKKCFPELEL